MLALVVICHEWLRVPNPELSILIVGGVEHLEEHGLVRIAPLAPCEHGDVIILVPTHVSAVSQPGAECLPGPELLVSGGTKEGRPRCSPENSPQNLTSIDLAPVLKLPPSQ